MNLILITPPHYLRWEKEVLLAALDIGVAHIHIRKPKREMDSLRQYLDVLPTAILSHSYLHYYESLLDIYGVSHFHISASMRENELQHSLQKWADKNYTLSTSFHHPKEIQDCKKYFHHAFCSPVFPSISKKGHTPSILWEVHEFSMMEVELYALGGIDEDKIQECKARGFHGIAILGAIWGQKDAKTAIQKLMTIKKLCDQLA